MESAAASGAEPSKTSHVPALDGLRAIAVTVVFLYHAFNQHKVYKLWSVVRLGYLGVDAFFVLSGFLITLRLFAVVEAGRMGGGRLVPLAIFFLKRAARTFPLYYAVLFAFMVFGADMGLGYLPGIGFSYWTYTFNIVNFYRAGWSGDGGHFWSLCVEEQFYLALPALIMTPARRLLPALAALGIAGSFVAREVLVGAAGRGAWAWQLPLLHFDTLGAGVLAACAVSLKETTARVAWRRASDVAGLVSGAAFFVLVLTGPHGPRWESALPLTLGIATASLVVALWERRLPRVARALGARPLAALGRISYGVYIFHLFVIMLIWRARWPWLPPVAWMRGALAFVFTLLLATASWFALENPILKFVHRRTRPTPPTPHDPKPA